MKERPKRLSVVDQIREGLEEAVRHAKDELNVSTKTVQSWEHGTRRPSQAALRLIQVLRQNPAGVYSAVGLSPITTKR
jgi:DNA-binding transcriptional regulator YiaG